MHNGVFQGQLYDMYSRLEALVPQPWKQGKSVQTRTAFMRSVTICVGRLTLAAEPAHAQLSRFYHGSTCDVNCVTSHTRPSPNLCNNGRGLGTRLHMYYCTSWYTIVLPWGLNGFKLHEVNRESNNWSSTQTQFIASKLTADHRGHTYWPLNTLSHCRHPQAICTWMQ